MGLLGSKMPAGGVAHPGPNAPPGTRMDASGLDLHWWSRKELRRHKSDLIVSTYQCLIFFILKHSSIENTICSKEKWENVHSKNNKILQKMATNPYKMCLWCLLCARSAYEHLSTYCVSKKKLNFHEKLRTRCNAAWRYVNRCQRGSGVTHHLENPVCTTRAK